MKICKMRLALVLTTMRSGHQRALWTAASTALVCLNRADHHLKTEYGCDVGFCELCGRRQTSSHGGTESYRLTPQKTHQGEAQSILELNTKSPSVRGTTECPSSMILLPRAPHYLRSLWQQQRTTERAFALAGATSAIIMLKLVDAMIVRGDEKQEFEILDRSWDAIVRISKIKFSCDPERVAPNPLSLSDLSEIMRTR